MPHKPPPLLVALLKDVPNIPQWIKKGWCTAEIYDVVLQMIADHRSDDFREWDDLAQIVRQNQALLRAAPQ